MPFGRMTSCVMEALTAVVFSLLCPLCIGERVFNIKAYRGIHRKLVLSEEVTHTHGKVCRHRIIQNKQFSEPDSDPKFYGIFSKSNKI